MESRMASTSRRCGETRQSHRLSGSAAILSGPEGGSDERERALLRAHPCVKPITLGPRILRGETAAIAALALWMGAVGDWHGTDNTPA